VRELAEEFRRVQKVIQADKAVMSDACKSLVLQDFAEKFNEYFELVGLPRMDLTCQNGIYTVELKFQADRIKKFNVLAR
jgi:hypothetical protein